MTPPLLVLFVILAGGDNLFEIFDGGLQGDGTLGRNDLNSRINCALCFKAHFGGSANRV